MTDTAQPAATSYPANDPATRRTVPATSTPLDPQRIEALMAKEWERFTASTPGSAAHHARASVPLPLGVASSFQHWDPHPLAFKAAKGAWLTDVDDRQVLDLSMGFGAMLVGHLNPLVVEYVAKALETGTLFVTPSPTTTDIAERYQKRFHLEQVRFANSGTEADMEERAITNGEPWGLARLLMGARSDLLAPDWLAAMRTPCALAPFYGYLIWLNTDRRIVPSASETSFFAVGAGSSVIWHDPARDLVVVIRWIEADGVDAVVGAVNEALEARR